MKKYLIIVFIFCLFINNLFAQTDTTKKNSIPEIFSRITKSITDFQLDTTSAPNDKITKKIIELRNFRGGFNINEVIEFKIEEDRQKNEVPKAELDKVETFFKSGNGKRWLDKTMIWIYRNHFTYSELKKLVKFYKTPAGQKMATELPLIMVKSLKAGEMIKEFYPK
ncbi:MAG: DUF2059 domain-containing protein [Chitinophagaceae bacterium]|nr:DUF2059 domain-containing protein [Chitinophagaceae bacterium]